ncbi:MAG TPA: DNA replication/repair protein RecF, partial [Bacteroidales bacterium]|nr:DNA replication/repair protein RecF [Bacteroidales bacterium]
MYLHDLQLINFKNYQETSFQFSDKINCFVGNNGAGKTNLLDAIHYMSFTRSYFNAVDNNTIRHSEPFFALHGHYFKNSDGILDKVSCVVKRNQRKQFYLNTEEYTRLSEHIGLFPVVMVSPYDRDLINLGSEVRRKYLDTIISQFDPVYLKNLIFYNKALFQRNTLLKSTDSQPIDYSLFDVWNRQLAEYGEAIYEQRRLFITNFSPVFARYFETISGSGEEVEIVYKSQLSVDNTFIALQGNLQKDILLKHTTFGIHRDDLLFNINGYPAKVFGSQGQQKSFIVAIKLAQFEYTRNIKGFKPLLLFDDIFDKLDDNRVRQIVDLVSQKNFGQVFITDT